MIEYQVRIVDEEGTGDLERLLNEYARDGWRLVSTAVFTEGTHRPRLYIFLEREVGEREKQDEWRAQHGGRDAADSSDRARLRAAYSVLRKRLLAERKLEEARMVQSRDALTRINRELAAVERDQRQLEAGSRVRRRAADR